MPLTTSTILMIFYFNICPALNYISNACIIKKSYQFFLAILGMLGMFGVSIITLLIATLSFCF